MSSTTPSRAIQRFTRNWIIRFMELTPQEKITMVSTISPLFTYYANKHAPHFCGTCYTSGDYLEAVLSSVKTDIVFTECLIFHRTEALAKFLHPRIHFYLKDVYVDGFFNQSWVFNDVKKLLTKSVKKVTFLDKCNFSRDLLFSELWPMICHCEDISISVKNLKFDFVFDKTKPCQQLAKLEVFELPASMDVVYPIVDQFLTTKCPNSTLTLFFKKGSTIDQIQSLAEVMWFKIRLAGFTITVQSCAYVQRHDAIAMKYVVEKRQKNI